VKEVTIETFKSEVEESTQPVLVKFFATWCGPCKAMSPILEELAAETPSVKFVEVNVERARDLAVRYRVRAVPTLMLFVEGALVTVKVGAATKTEIADLLTGLRK